MGTRDIYMFHLGRDGTRERPVKTGVLVPILYMGMPMTACPCVVTPTLVGTQSSKETG